MTARSWLFPTNSWPLATNDPGTITVGRPYWCPYGNLCTNVPVSLCTGTLIAKDKERCRLLSDEFHYLMDQESRSTKKKASFKVSFKPQKHGMEAFHSASIKVIVMILISTLKLANKTSLSDSRFSTSSGTVVSFPFLGNLSHFFHSPDRPWTGGI